MGECNSLQCFALLLLLSALHIAAPRVHASNPNPKIGCMKHEREALLTFTANLTDPHYRLSSWEDEDCCRWRGVHTAVPCVHASNPNPKIGCMKHEREALLTFRANLTDPHYRLSSWEDEDCCGWRGVSCSTTSGHVIKLDLRNNDNGTSALGGEINPSLLALTHLRHLDLSFNHISGTEIPKFIGSFENLRYLNLSHTSFKGRIPPHLGNVSSLCYLDLGYSHSLYADDLGWLSLLPSLKFLDLSGADITAVTDWLHIVNALPSLSVLRLRDCRLHSIPTWLPNVNLTTLTTLDLSSNYFNSMLPEWLGNTSSLTYLDLSLNRFHGPIPEALGGLTFLEFLGLASNDLEGSIPVAFRSFSHLKHLDLGNNRLRGNLSEWLEEMTSLTYLDLSANLLDDQIPARIGMLSQLEVLILSNNSLHGVITEDMLANLTRLKQLSLSFNSLAIDVDDHWVPSFELHVLELHSCQLGPHFPAWLRWQQQIDILVLSNTGIIDIVPDWFWNSSAWSLALSTNQISGRLPRSLEFMPVKFMDLSDNRFEGPLPRLPHAIYYLDLSNNSISGALPLHFEAPELTALFLSSNHIEGTIPQSICTNFSILDLSSNHLSGQLPHCSKESQLMVLNLANNNLSGDISSSVGSLTSLTALSLSNNKFYGAFPTSLKNCKKLSLLDLGENRFSGVIPTWVGQYLPSLVILRLRSNLFQGNIPSELAELQHLQILDLAHNNLSGCIPQSFSNFSAMASKLEGSLSRFSHFIYVSDGITFDCYQSLLIVTKGEVLRYTKVLPFMKSMDLSDNNLSGEIPQQIVALSGLKNLNLSVNNLKGEIPENIGELQSLESLDLSRNDLFGVIPVSISTLTSLSHLNLSHNNFSGRIPLGTQLQTLNDLSIYIGNAELCGPPLDKDCFTTTKFEVGNGQYEKGFETMWFYLGMGMGHMVGFWVCCAVLLLKTDWRYNYFRFIDSMYDRIYVAVALNIAKFVKMFGRNSARVAHM